MQSSTISGVSPSFTSHSSSHLVDVAARVVQEFRHENGDDYDDIFNFNDFHYDNSEFSAPADERADTNTPPQKLKDDKNCDDDEFEFAVVCTDVNSSSISADEIFSQGHIWPRYPLFDTSLLVDVDPNLTKVVNGSPETDCKPSLVVRLPLRKLFSEERDFAEWSSSEAEDLDGVTPGSFCVWNPKPESPERSKKSNSSRRWKFSDILHRSNSDGKETKETPFLLFKPLIATNKKINNEYVKKVEKSAKVAAAVGDGASAEENNPSENRGSRRRSYLPSGQALVGAFSHIHMGGGRRCRQCGCRYGLLVGDGEALWNNGAIMRQLFEKLKGRNVKYEKVKGGIKKKMMAENTKSVVYRFGSLVDHTNGGTTGLIIISIFLVLIVTIFVALLINDWVICTIINSIKK